MVDSAQADRLQAPRATDVDSQCANLSQQTFVFPIASFAAAVIGLAVILVQEVLGPDRFDLLVAAFVLLSVGILGLSITALCRGRLLESVRRHEARTQVRHLELRDMATRDDLTGLPNRRYFYAALQDELELARNLHRHLAVLVLDVDGFKQINDTYGHQVGDVVLANVGKLLAGIVRGSDLPARIGGDEFAILLAETNKDGAFAMATRLQQALEGALVFDEDGVQIHLHLSLGISGYPWGGDSVDAIVQSADTKMYAAKASHKDALA
jgi:diguanylate cyclase (GGDEF)-like protein